MNILHKWLKRETNITIKLTIISGVFLLLNLTVTQKIFYIDYSWITIILSGTPIVYNSIKKLLQSGKIRAGFLISLALSACIYIGEYFAAGEIVFIMMIGELLEDYTVNRSRAGLHNLIAMKPPTARICKENTTQILPAEKVKPGDQVRVNSGETVPVDGIIIAGQTSIDQSLMTGESLPIDKKTGDEVFCATTNQTGSILIKATKTGDNSSLAKMIRLIREAENQKAPIIGTMDKLAGKLVLLAVILSIITGLLTNDIIRGITVLVVFCPCALVLSTPTAIAAGIGNATKHGIIIKSGAALEQLADIDRITFDKTGTLTTGKLEIKEIYLTSNSSINEAELLQFLASTQQHSEHPIGKAILKRAKKDNINLIEPDHVKIFPGKGIMAKISNNLILTGNLSFMQDSNILLTEILISQYTEMQNSGETTIFVAINNDVIGIISLTDKLRKDAKEIVQNMKSFNKDLTLLTGDSKVIADKISTETGIKNFQAELLPEEKVSAIEKFSDKGEKVCMIGDGINDAPALKIAHIGIAMADIGSDIAADSSDIILVKDEIIKLPYIFSLSQRVKKKIKQNIKISFILNFTAIGLASIGILNPISGALIHNVSSILVVLNAAILLKK